ncbi:MAG: extracellular solute-binding protein [Acetatifactor sp.]|nr:extracellular solute-binding protein [Acetatifactor sp.]
MGKCLFQRIVSVGLTLALVVGLCACGGKSADGEGGSLSADSDAGSVNDTDSSLIAVNDNVALAKENVYRVSDVAIPMLDDDVSNSVECAAYRDGRIYVVMGMRDWDKVEVTYTLLSMDEGESAFQSVPMELPASEERKQGEDVRYSDFTIGADGKVYALCRYQDFYEDSFPSQQYACCWDAGGTLLWRTDITSVLHTWDDKEELTAWTIFPVEGGSAELILTGKNAYRLPLGQDGAPAAQERLSEETAKAFRSCRSLIRKEDGVCLLLCREAAITYSLRQYDIRTDALGEVFVLPDELFSPYSATLAAGVDSDMVYVDSMGVFAYDMGDVDGKLKMNYVNSDKYITAAHCLLALDETRFFMIYREDYTSEMKAGMFEYVAPEDIPDKAVVVLAGIGVNGGIKKQAIRYNRESDRYRVVLREYESVERLNLDMVSGNRPDLLMAEGLPMNSYIAKGLIADVNPLIEGDEELSQTEFLENVFDAYSVDGKLMYVVPSFTLSIMAARTDIVGEGGNWSMERMREALAGMQADAQLLDGLNRDVFMEKVMEYRGNDFIDPETGSCSFDSTEFIEIMKYAYTLPEERRYAAESGEGEYELQYLKERTLLMELSVWSFSQSVDERLYYKLNGYLGGDYVFVGFPGDSGKAAGSGTGALIRGQNLMALLAQSENPDGAWDFARFYLTEEYQSGLESSLPVNKRIFEEWAKEETKRSYYMDENGEKVEYDLTLYQNGEAAVVPPLSQEQLDELIAYVESTTQTSFEDANVLNIISEEMGSFFAGDKKAEDVASIIQSRVQMYVQENR